MTRSRLEAFSDAVIAILITIMVLELRPPAGDSWTELREAELLPVFSAYVLSFVFLGIYWNNHHHMLHLVDRITGGILWANLHLLFWLSLFPFATAWMGESGFAGTPLAVYGMVSLGAAIAYFILQQLIIRDQGPDSKLAAAVGNDLKGKMSPALYALGIVFSFFASGVALAFYILVALMWLIPDRRIESAVNR
jgi:uncharacterized membrane protein